MNKLRPHSIKRIQLDEDGIVRASNMAKFIETYSVNGFPPEDLFLHDDLICVTSDSLARVAKTIIALIKCKWEEMPAPIRSHIPRRKWIVKPDEKPRVRQPTTLRHLQIRGDSSPVSIPPAVPKYIARELEIFNVQPTKNQSNSGPRGNQFNSCSKRSQFNSESKWNQSNPGSKRSLFNSGPLKHQSAAYLMTSHLRTKHSVTPGNVTVNGSHSTQSSQPVSEADVGNDSSSTDNVGTSSGVPLIERLVDPIRMSRFSRICMDTSNDYKPWNIFVLGEESMAWTKFVRLSSLLCCLLAISLLFV